MLNIIAIPPQRNPNTSLTSSINSTNTTTTSSSNNTKELNSECNTIDERSIKESFKLISSKAASSSSSSSFKANINKENINYMINLSPHVPNGSFTSSITKIEITCQACNQVRVVKTSKEGESTECVCKCDTISICSNRSVASSSSFRNIGESNGTKTSLLASMNQKNEKQTLKSVSTVSLTSLNSNSSSTSRRYSTSNDSNNNSNNNNGKYVKRYSFNNDNMSYMNCVLAQIGV